MYDMLSFFIINLIFKSITFVNKTTAEMWAWMLEEHSSHQTGQATKAYSNNKQLHLI